MVRYCDDFVMLFACKEDAERVHEVLGKRLAKFGLEFHAVKTRLIDFGPPAERTAKDRLARTLKRFNEQWA